MSHEIRQRDRARAFLPAGPPRAPGITARVAGCTVAVRTDGSATLDWLLGYLAGFWQTEPGAAGGADFEVLALVDRQARRVLCALVDRCAAAEEVAMFMGATGRRIVRSGPHVVAGCPDQRIALVRDRCRITVLGDDRDALGPATVRVVRAAADASLTARGWAQAHVAGAARGETGLLAFGRKGAGKTAAVMALAARGGWRILAHDRAYVNVVAGRPRVVPWPSSLNIGLGLLAALGWASTLGALYRGGERPPYRQPRAVTSALITGRTTAVRERSGELKAQLLPAQVTEWFGVGLAPSAALAAVVFPRTDLARGQPLVQPLGCAAFSEADVFPPHRGADHFPDFLCLTGNPAANQARSALEGLRTAAGMVPAYRVVLGRDLAANASALARLVP